MSNKKTIAATEQPNNEQGFSLLEAVVAILLITIGLIGTAAAITYALEFGTVSKNVTNAKLVIVSTIEEIESLRNSRRLGFAQIANVGAVDNSSSLNSFAGFSSGYKEISLNPGPDGVNGTDDDLKDPGPDGKFGTGDDFDNQALIRSGYVRRITITTFPGTTTIKKVEVNVRYYSTGGKVGEITGICYLNDEARGAN